MARRNIGVSLIPYLAWALTCFLGTSAAKSLPNIVFIVLDDVGWNDIGYHNDVIKTPNIDDLAKNGVILDNYYVGAVCVPSRNMLMSGRYAIHLGLQHNDIGFHPRSLPLDEVTIADKLKEHGYATHIVGKWHCGFYREECLPNNRGFDSSFGYLSALMDHFSHKLEGLWDLQRDSVNVGPEYFGHYSTHIFTKEAEEIVRRHDRNKPLFLYLAYSANHEPVAVPPEYEKQYMFIDDPERRTLAGMTSCVDEGIGNLTETMKKHGLLENTVIVLTSDNGGDTDFGGNNWPLKGKKATLWDGGVRVPAFVNSPLLHDNVRGSKYKGLMHITDWFPTLLHLAGGTSPSKKLDGVNQWKSISEGAPSKRKDALLNINTLNSVLVTHDPKPFSDNPYFDIRIQSAIREGIWKLMTGKTGNTHWIVPPESQDAKLPEEEESELHNVHLYNIAEDPGEVHNLALQRPDVVMRLLKKLAGYYETYVPPQTQTEPQINFREMGDFWHPWV